MKLISHRYSYIKDMEKEVGKRLKKRFSIGLIVILLSGCSFVLTDEENQRSSEEKMRRSQTFQEQLLQEDADVIAQQEEEVRIKAIQRIKEEYGVDIEIIGEIESTTANLFEAEYYINAIVKETGEEIRFHMTEDDAIYMIDGLGE